MATDACIRGLRGIELAPDGTLYILSLRNTSSDQWRGYEWFYIRRIDPAGIIVPVGCVADDVRTFAVAPNGDFYMGISGGNTTAVISRCGANGEMTRVAGTGVRGFGGDGGLATEALLQSGLDDLAFGPDGSLYVADTWNNRVRRIDTQGIIDTVVGGGSLTTLYGDVSIAPARQISLNQGPDSVAVNGAGVYADSDSSLLWRIGSPLPSFTNDEIAIASEDGRELYKFSPEGRHLETLNALTGATLYRFGYDAAGRLASVTDGDGNITTIERLGDGTPTAIVAPFGQRTALAVNAEGYLSAIADPGGNAYALTYRAGGLLETLTDPNGRITRFAYDADGLLTLDENAAGGGLTLNRTGGYSDDFTVSVKPAEANATTYRVERTTTNDRRWTNTFPDGAVATALFKADDPTEVRLPDGIQTRRVDGADPRFGLDSPVPTSFTVTTPGGRAASLARNRSVTLDDPKDILSLKTLTEATTLNGRTSTSVFDAATRTYTSRTPAGRQTQTVINPLGRLTESRTTGLLPVNATYNANGRLDTLTQGAGPDARAVTFAYDADGYLDSITDALGRSAGFAYDPAGRVTRQTFPDGRAVEFDYDAKGNLTSLTPPGRPAHAFTYTPVDLTAEYLPPDVGAGTNSTQYSYNRDKQLTRVLRPDGKTVDLDYDAAGRLATLTVPEGVFGYAYHATSGHLSQITAPDGGALSFSYDGALLTGAAWTGTVAGSVGFAYDNDFRVTSVTVNGADPVAYAYDPDSLLIQAGGLTLSRDPQNGLLTGATLGAVADTWSYNGFGEPATYRAAQGATSLLDVAYTRDALGRITEKTETVGGVTATYAYGYDLAGRLVEVKEGGAVQATWGYDANGNRTHPRRRRRDRSLRRSGPPARLRRRDLPVHRQRRTEEEDSGRAGHRVHLRRARQPAASQAPRRPHPRLPHRRPQSPPRQESR
jgi:YD repeat-containing protein